MMDENQQLVFIEYFFLAFISENYNAKNTYRTRAIITRGLYYFYPIFLFH